MPKQTFPLSKFGRIVSVLEGESKQVNAKDSYNVRLLGSKLAPRYGFANTAIAPVGTFASLGLGIVTSGTSATEGISVETRAGVTRPYSINLSTFARTQIGTETLAATPWVISQYGDTAYLINPGGVKTVYRHVIGNIGSLEAIQDTGYVEPIDSPLLTITKSEPSTIRGWLSTDTLVYTNANAYNPASIVVTYNADGSVKFAADSTDTGGDAGGTFDIENTFAADADLSGADYFYIELEGLNYLQYFNACTTLPQFKIAGIWVNVTDAKFIRSEDEKKAVWVIYAKGLTLTAVQGIKYRIQCKPGRGATTAAQKEFVKVSPVVRGGTYIEGSAAGDRLWDSPLDGDGVTYGIRFTDGGVTVSSIVQKTLTADECRGFVRPGYGIPMGGIVRIESTAPGLPYDRTEFLRLDESVSPAQWKVIQTVTAAPFTTEDRRMEHEIPALTTIATGTAPPTSPTFNSVVAVGAFPYKNSMVWLQNATSDNIEISRVGDPLELYNPLVTYDDDDLTAPGRLTLADNNADVPLWGVQAGLVAIVVGSKAAYAFGGDFPSVVTPSRQIPGSRGIAGYFAGTRFRPKDGQYAAAYMDSDVNVWVVSSVPKFTEDTSSSPVELSLAVRGKLKEFLLDDQKGEFPTLTVSSANLEFEELTGSLWCFLGRRAAVFRQDLSGDGWEFYEYQLTTPPGLSSVSTCSPFEHLDASPSSVAPGTVWAQYGYALESDDAWATSGTMSLGTSSFTEILRTDGFTPSSPVPASATIDSIAFKVERSFTGDLAVTETTVQPRKSGVSTGANLSTSYVLTDTDVASNFALAVLPTVAEINSGQMGIDLRYQQQDWLADWDLPANWTTPAITLAGTTTVGDTGNHNYAIMATYGGGGTAPPFVYVNATIESSAFPASAGAPVPTSYTGTATVNNGIDGTASGSIQNPTTPGNESIVTVSSSKRVKLLNIGGNNFSSAFIASGTHTLNLGSTPSDIRVEVSGTSVFSPIVPSTVRVDSIEMKVCYTVTTVMGASSYGVSLASCCFDGGINLAIRSTGQLDLIERDSRSGMLVGGTSRDGGYPMPNAFWESQDISFEGKYAQIVNVQTHTSDRDAVVVKMKSDDADWEQGTAVALNSRWNKFSLGMKGIRFNARVEFSETLADLSGLTFEFSVKSRGMRQ